VECFAFLIYFFFFFFSLLTLHARFGIKIERVEKAVLAGLIDFWNYSCLQHVFLSLIARVTDRILTRFCWLVF